MRLPAAAPATPLAGRFGHSHRRRLLSCMHILCIAAGSHRRIVLSSPPPPVKMHACIPFAGAHRRARDRERARRNCGPRQRVRALGAARAHPVRQSVERRAEQADRQRLPATQRISSINSISALCEATGADVQQVAHKRSVRAPLFNLFTLQGPAPRPAESTCVALFWPQMGGWSWRALRSIQG